jgi:dipeptidyl aminopeptidase/acylaminoacyl peptidase
MINLLLSLILLSPLAGPPANNECKKLLTDAFALFKQRQENPYKGLSVKYNVESTDNSGTISRQDISMRVFETKVLVESTDYTLYQDEQSVVAVRPSSNSIIISANASTDFRKLQFTNVIAGQDSLLNNIEIKSCSEDRIGEKVYKKIICKIPERYSKGVVDEVTYWVDGSDKSLKRITIVYRKDSDYPIRLWTVQLNEMNTAFKTSPFDGTAVAVVLDNGKLKKQFAGYTVIDNRK